MKKCRVKGCRNRFDSQRHHSPWCPRCRHRRFKEAWPLKYFYQLLKGRAKERGKEFLLSFAEYEAFCLKTNYHKLKGKTSLSLSINRKDNARGYSADNIEAITLSENSRKNHVPRIRQYAEQFGIKL